MRGIDTKDTAIAYAIYYNNKNDHTLIDEEILIEVENEYGQREKFKIGAEVSIDYTAAKIEDDVCN